MSNTHIIVVVLFIRTCASPWDTRQCFTRIILTIYVTSGPSLSPGVEDPSVVFPDRVSSDWEMIILSEGTVKWQNFLHDIAVYQAKQYVFLLQTNRKQWHFSYLMKSYCKMLYDLLSSMSYSYLYYSYQICCRKVLIFYNVIDLL